MLHQELAFLNENNFQQQEDLNWQQFPLADEPFIGVWEEYIQDISRLGVIEALRTRLPQLNFPVREGMSADAGYQEATRKGRFTADMMKLTPLLLEKPEGLKVYLHPTLAGRIPVMETSHRHDFETLVQVFSYRNEPRPLPASMGACMIKGYNNWDRVARYKRQMGEQFDFGVMKARPGLYRDTFLILSDREYSGVPADMLGLPADEWRRLSLIIRREHEATHYFTLRCLKSAQNHLLDELIADYMGIAAAIGSYRADWFLAFLGLEDYPAYRESGRLRNYLRQREISAEAFEELKTWVKKAALNLERISADYDLRSERDKYELLLYLTRTNIVALASRET